MKKKVVLISTGGTIASGVNPETGLLTSGMLTGEELSKQCILPEYIDLQVESLFQLPSNEMDFDRLVQLKEKIESVFENKDIAGVVVTHGTDTMEETAYFLDLTIGDERPVVVTGAQRSPMSIGTDAFSNLRQAIILAASSEARNLGAVVLFNEKILPARYVKKIHASNVDGFGAPGFGELGYVDDEEVILYGKVVKRETYELKSTLPYVEIIKCSLGSDGRLITYAVDSGAKGIVIEAFGRGQVHPKVAEHVQYAIEKGAIVVITTSTIEGRVKVVYDSPGTAFDLKKKGAILAEDYDSKKARMKLAVMLAAGVGDIKKRF